MSILTSDLPLHLPFNNGLYMYDLPVSLYAPVSQGVPLRSWATLVVYPYGTRCWYRKVTPREYRLQGCTSGALTFLRTKELVLKLSAQEYLYTPVYGYELNNIPVVSKEGSSE